MSGDDDPQSEAPSRFGTFTHDQDVKDVMKSCEPLLVLRGGLVYESRAIASLSFYSILILDF
jgi:hypothetical protein